MSLTYNPSLGKVHLNPIPKLNVIGSVVRTLTDTDGQKEGPTDGCYTHSSIAIVVQTSSWSLEVLPIVRPVALMCAKVGKS